MKNLAPYKKTVVAVVGTLIGWSTAVVQSAPAQITATEWIMLATGVAVSLGVYQAENAPKG